MPDILIYRNNMFRISEPFIIQQAGQTKRFRPIHIGRLRCGNSPAGTESLALQDIPEQRRPHRFAWQVLTRDPRPYQRLLGDRRPVLIHAHFGIDGVYALPLAKRLGVPLVTTFHGFDATLNTGVLLSSPAWANYPLFRRRLAQQGNLFLCVSSFIRDQVLALGFPAERTHVHYIGIDTQATRSRDPGEEMPIILHVARLVKMKGTKYLIRAFCGIAWKMPDVELVIIGDGPERRSLQALARSIGLASRIKFLGAQPHAVVMSWMRRSAMLVLPSVRTKTGRTEGLGMVLLEAAATGIPVIGSRSGGIPEVVIDGQTGCLIKERDVDALTIRLGELLGDRARRIEMGRRARALIEQRFDILRQTGILERHYDAVLSPDSSRPYVD